MTKTLQISGGGVSWQAQTDLTVCPLGFFKGEQTFNNVNDVELTCYREGIIKLQLLSYNDTARGIIVVTPMFSKFRNSYVREKINEIYDFDWTVSNV